MSRKKLGSWRLRMGSVAVVIVVAGIAAKLFTPLGGIVNAADAGSGQTEIPSSADDPSQEDILDDGVVTREEYDSAVSQTLACVRAAGGEIADLRYDDVRDRPVYTFGVRYDEPVSPGDDSPYDGCWAMYSRDVQAQWVAQHEPTDAKKAENEARAVACIEEEHLEISSLAELNDLTSPESYAGVMRCKFIAFKGYDPREHPSALQPGE